VAAPTLEHFYYGQRVRGGKPESELQLLAASSGVGPEQIAEAIKQALIPPVAGWPTGSWALVRGRRALPFTLVQSQVADSGGTVLHYLIAPPDALRTMGGNLKALSKVVEDKAPVFAEDHYVLKPLALPEAEAPSQAEQIEDILSLMDYTGNRAERIEALLSAVVQGVPVIILNAPPELATRVTFLQGLLALLPPSARFGVTFATHSLTSTKIDVQIRFVAGDAPSEEAVVYDWATREVSGKTVEDAYSRFIISQLRLDAELVSKQTRGLTAVAAWRIKRGESLADALGYAAWRFKVDDALLNNQPVEAADVSKVLAEDPTLTEELKIAYTRHLLAFALALGDMTHADPIAVMLRQQPDLELALQNQFSDAAADGKAGLVYDTLSRWLANPLGPQGMKWVEVTHRAALANMDALVKARDIPGVNRFLESIQKADPGVEVSRIVPRLVEMALPLTVLDTDLNLTVFLLAVNYLEGDVLRRLISSQKFVSQLPPSLGRLVPFITGEDAGLCPSGLLVDTAQSFGDEWRDLVLIRLAEVAVLSGRLDVVDMSALSGLVHLLPSPWGVRYGQVLAWIAKNISSDETIQTLEDPGPTYILQMLLALGAYGDLANEMLHQARLLYPGDLQTKYVRTVRQLFAETPLAVEQIPVALDVIGKGGIKSLPLAMAYIGALEGHEWSSALDPVAEDATKMLFENSAILEVMPPNAMIALLRFHIKRKDVGNTVRVAGLLPQVAAREGKKGIGIVGRMYKLMDWDDKVKLAALELLRRYIRLAEDEDARQAITAFGREFGQNVQLALEATYAFKRMMGGVELADYAEFLHTAAEFLHDNAAAYADKNRIPSIGALLNDLDGLPGGLNHDERRTITREMIAMGKAVIALGDHSLSNRPRDPEKHVDNLLAGKDNPISPLDVYWVLGGYLTKGKRYPLKLTREGGLHPLAERSAPMLRDESQIINGLLRGLIRAFPLDRKLTLPTSAIRDEMESLWGDIPLAEQREIVRNLAIDLQRVAELTAWIAAQGGGKALEEGGASRRLDENKQQPKNPAEFYRFVSGYFKQRTK
jgi:hypothetical protein